MFLAFMRCESFGEGEVAWEHKCFHSFLELSQTFLDVLI